MRNGLIAQIIVGKNWGPSGEHNLERPANAPVSVAEIPTSGTRCSKSETKQNLISSGQRWGRQRNRKRDNEACKKTCNEGSLGYLSGSPEIDHCSPEQDNKSNLLFWSPMCVWFPPVVSTLLWWRAADPFARQWGSHTLAGKKSKELNETQGGRWTLKMGLKSTVQS